MIMPPLQMDNQHTHFYPCLQPIQPPPKKVKDVYGKYSKDTGNTLRYKFLTLSIFQIFYGVFCRIPYRVFTLVSGDFIAVGYWKAKKEWNIDRQLWSLHYPAYRHLPGRVSLIFKSTKHILIQLSKNITKIITYPIALIALELAALIGLFFPFSGRVFYGKVEHAWARNNIIYSKNLCGHLRLRLSDYLDPHMLPVRIAKPLLPNLIRDYHPYTLRSLIGRTEKHLHKHCTFLENEKVDVQYLLNHLAYYHKHIRNFSYIDSSEFDRQGQLKHDMRQKAIAEKLKGILSNLREIQQMRECIIFAQIQGNNCKKLKGIVLNCQSTINENINYLNQMFYIKT